MSPPTWGTTARLAALALGSVLLALGGCLGMVAWLVLHGDPAGLAAALGAVQAIGGAAMLALGGAGAIGSGVHGARHLGGPPAMTSAEISALRVSAIAGPDSEAP